jgi:hypothetical protein
MFCRNVRQSGEMMTMGKPSPLKIKFSKKRTLLRCQTILMEAAEFFSFNEEVELNIKFCAFENSVIYYY